MPSAFFLRYCALVLGLLVFFQVQQFVPFLAFALNCRYLKKLPYPNFSYSFRYLEDCEAEIRTSLTSSDTIVLS